MADDDATPHAGDAPGALWRGAPAPDPALAIVVVVPVRDEAMGLAATLASLAVQRDTSGERLDHARYEVLLLANNCTDDSAAIARDFARSEPGFSLHVAEVHLPAADAHIGHVRRLLMDAASERLGRVGAVGSIIASTDGDTVVDAHWLAATLREFEAGADAVGGRIALHPAAPLDPGTLRWQRCDTAYRLAASKLEDLLDPDPADPWPRHHQHFCASLAVSRAAYLHVGGVSAVRYLEDVALVAALRRAGLKLRHSPKVRVQTSARRDGRVEVGLSWQLRQWRDGQQGVAPMMVEDADAVAARIRQRRRCRDAWRAGSTQACADSTWAEREPSAGPVASSLVPVRQAIDRLKTLLRLHAAAPAMPRSNTSSR